MNTKSFVFLLFIGLCVNPLQAKQLTPSLPLVMGKTDIGTLLPDVPGEKVSDQWQNSRYGIVVGTNGDILLVYSPKGESLLSASSWYLQGQSKDAEGKTAFSYMGSGDFFKGPIVPKATSEGYRLYEIKDADSSYLRWSRRIICKPNAVRVEMVFTPIKAAPEAVTAGIQSRIKVLAKTVEPFGQPNANPISILTPSSKFEINYDPEMSWYKGYYIQNDLIVFAPLFKSAFTVGQTVSFGYDITF